MRKKKTREFFHGAFKKNLIESVEHNWTITLVQKWGFFLKSEQSYKFFVFPQSAVSFENLKIILINLKITEFKKSISEVLA